MAGSGSAKAVRKAIYDKLVANTALVTLLGNANRIVSTVARQNQAFPYVLVGERTTDPRLTNKTDIIQTHRVRIHAFTNNQPSPEKCEEIRDAIYNALVHQALSPSAPFVWVDTVQEGIDDCNLMEDGRTHHSITEFAVTLH